MGVSPDPAEQAMLDIVAHHDPIDYHSLKKRVGQRLNGGYTYERHRAALDNLEELNMISKPGIAHEYVHITPQGWAHLGGEQPRHPEDTEVIDAPVCPVCATDKMVEQNW